MAGWGWLDVGWLRLFHDSTTCHIECLALLDYRRKDRVMEMLGALITPRLTVPKHGGASVVSDAALELSTADSV